MRFHPFADIFPLMEGDDFAGLVADVKAHGLREKVVTYRGQILDGRNRFLACQRAKVKPQFRVFSGNDADALAYVVSSNVHRRHLDASQRALAAARIESAIHGGDRKSDQDANLHLDRSTVAESMSVSPRSVASARKVIDAGSKALVHAVEAGEVSVSKAASVVDLPKSEQLKAATAKPAASDVDDEFTPDEIAKAEAIEREYEAAMAKVMDSDDKLAAAHTEIKRQAAEIAVLKLARDGFMNGKAAITRLLGQEQRKVERLEKKLKAADVELESLRERVAIMGAA